MSDSDLQEILDAIFNQSLLISGVISSPRSRGQCVKISCRPVMIKNRLFYQLTSFFEDKTLHVNLPPEEGKERIFEALLHHFKQGVLKTSMTDYHILINKKKEVTIKKKASTPSALSLTHNRSKQHLLKEGDPIPFLIELGVMTHEGRVVAKKSQKFKQINRFLEMIDDTLDHFPKNTPLHIIDFGCGKSYLTFALYHYLSQQGFSATIVGLDLKESVITECQQIAQRLHLTGLSFAVGDISHYQPMKKVDMVITLHACDTATDAALAKAIEWDAKAILSVPCCQHELYHQVDNASLAPLLNHGILKERFAALATDAARAQLLDILGYQTQILEFIDLEHTPKNLLIRAIKKGPQQKKKQEEKMSQYQEFKKTLNISPSLEKMLGNFNTLF